MFQRGQDGRVFRFIPIHSFRVRVTVITALSLSGICSSELYSDSLSDITEFGSSLCLLFRSYIHTWLSNHVPGVNPDTQATENIKNYIINRAERVQFSSFSRVYHFIPPSPILHHCLITPYRTSFVPPISESPIHTRTMRYEHSNYDDRKIYTTESTLTHQC